MQLDFTPAQEAEIRRRAIAEGYDTPEQYLVDLGLDSIESPTREELEASAARCDRGMADAEAGRGVPMGEALTSIAKELGLADPKA